MISNQILKAVDNGKTVKQALSKVYEDLETQHFNYQLNKYLSDYAKAQDEMEPFVEKADDYERQISKLEIACQSINEFSSYAGSLTVSSDLEKDSQSSDDKEDCWFYIVKDEDLDYLADELNDEFDKAGFNHPLVKYFIYVSIFVKKGSDVSTISDKVSEYKKSGKDSKALVKEILLMPNVNEISFDYDF